MTFVTRWIRLVKFLIHSVKVMLQNWTRSLSHFLLLLTSASWPSALQSPSAATLKSNSVQIGSDALKLKSICKNVHIMTPYNVKSNLNYKWCVCCCFYCRGGVDVVTFTIVQQIFNKNTQIFWATFPYTDFTTLSSLSCEFAMLTNRFISHTNRMGYCYSAFIALLCPFFKLSKWRTAHGH